MTDWNDTSSRFALDALLRAYGFIIFERSSLGNKWKRRRLVYSEEEALNMLPSDDVSDAEYLDMLYWEGFDLFNLED